MGVVAITVKLVLQKWGLRQFRLFSTQGHKLDLAYYRAGVCPPFSTQKEQ